MAGGSPRGSSKREARAAAAAASRRESCRRGPRRWRGRSPARARRRALRFPCGRARTSGRSPPRGPCGRPGPWSSTVTIDVLARRRGADLDRAAGGRVLRGVLQQVAQHALDQRRRRCAPAAGPRAGETSHAPRIERRRSSPSSALPTTSSSGCHCRFSCTWPDCRRAMSSRLLTSEFMRSAASRIAARRSRPCAPRRAALRHRQRLGHADQRRQRRAQVVRDRGQQRIAQPLRFHLHRRPLRDVDVVDALERDREQRRAGVEQPALLGAQPAAPGSRARSPARRAGASAPSAARRAPASRAACRCRARRPRRGRRPIARCRGRCRPAACGDGSGAATRSSRSATISAAGPRTPSARKRAAISAICSAIKAPERSRDISYSALTRSSRRGRHPRLELQPGGQLADDQRHRPASRRRSAGTARR